MKRILILAVMLGFAAMSFTGMAAMSAGKVRKNARFLTDRMAYELNLSSQQMNDVYEINYDFIYNVRYLMDDVVLGNTWALQDYYDMLDVRNEDLRWVLGNSQYVRFLGLEYFSRPIFASGNGWDFRVYVTYPNISFFYFGKPYHYRTYNGGHYRTYYDNRSYYSNRYHHDVYHGNSGFKDYNKYSRDDFRVTARPGTSVRPSGSSSRPNSRPSKDDIYDSRPSGSNGSRPSGSSVTTRPSGSSSTGSGSNVRPSGSSSSRPSGSNTTVRPSTTPSTGSGSNVRPSGSSSSRPSGSSTTVRPSTSSTQNSNARPSGSSGSRPSGSSRSSGTANESRSSSRSGGSSSGVSERPSSSSSSGSESRSSSGSSSNSSRGGRR